MRPLRHLWHDDQLAELFARRRHDGCRRLVWAPRVKRWLRVVLDEQLGELRRFNAELLGDERQRHIDPGRHPGGRDDLAVANDSFFSRNGTELFQHIMRKPMGSGLQSVKHAGSGQPQGSGADRGGLLGCAVHLCNPFQHQLIAHHRLWKRRTWDH